MNLSKDWRRHDAVGGSNDDHGVSEIEWVEERPPLVVLAPSLLFFSYSSL